MPQQTKILLVEDDAIIASGLVYALEQEGYSVTHCPSVREALSVSHENVQLALLDMQLPDGSGFDVRATLAHDTAVIFLTVIDDEGNIVKAFESGADDYITKPFRLRELLARIKRVLSIKSGGQSSAIFTLGGVSVDTSTGKAYIGGKHLDLTALEYRLLLTFAQNKGQILSRSQILESLWDAAGNFVEDNTLTVYIKRLREKLGDAVNIETIRGMGYRAE
ncbi:DNA-binding response regulator [Clostridia bacterium]|nr:DNA-binding response regulator [Clostridia bacterium]